LASHVDHPLQPVAAWDHAAGAPDAPVTLVEYGDFECPFSGMADPEIKVIHQRLGDRLRFVYRHLIRIRNVGGRLPKAG
jgi:Na+:H+ antiporter, NhaA family